MRPHRVVEALRRHLARADKPGTGCAGRCRSACPCRLRPGSSLSAAVPSSSAMPWSMISRTAVQSLSTNPWKPHSLRSTCVSVNGVGAGRHAVDGVEGGHEGPRARVHSRVERRQVHVPKRALRYLRRVVVPPAFRRPVSHEVLGARDDRGRIVEALALVAAHVGAGEGRPQVRVLAGALGDPPPARVARDVHHRRERPAHALARRLLRREARRLLHQGRVPARRKAQGDREKRPEAVDHVEPEEDRYVQPRALDRLPLVGVGLAGRHGVQDAADPALPDQLVAVRPTLRSGPVSESDGELVQLAGLFLEGHLPEQGLDPGLRLRARVPRPARRAAGPRAPTGAAIRGRRTSGGFRLHD